MSGTFSGYNISMSGMSVNQSALAVVGSNISNVNTAGYSRKQVSSAERVVSQSGGGSVGSGTDLAEVKRARNALLDQTYRNYNADKGYWEVKSTNLEDIQETLNEYSAADGSAENGLQQTLEEFFNSWEELSKDPSSLSNRQSALENAATLLSTLQDIDSQLEQLQQDCVTEVQAGVDRLNDLAAQIADLNTRIVQQELSGVEAGDLRDQRDSLLDEMSTLAAITTGESGNGVFTVTIGGVALVQGSQLHKLETSGAGTTEDPFKVQWADLGYEAAIGSGSIAAYLEDCDPSAVQDISSVPADFSAASGSSIANLRQGLNIMITAIAQEINVLHASGSDLEGNAGLDFFTTIDAAQPLSLSNMQVNPELTADPDKVVTSTSGAAEDNTIATGIYNLMDDEDLFLFNGLATDLNGYYESLISWVATAGETASGYYDTQSSLVKNVDTQRQSISAVSLDEEMTKMIMYQNAYNASAKVLSTIDGLLGELIQDLGGN